MVWSYLYTRTGAGSLPVTTPCTLRQLTEWLGRKDRSSASNALGRLIEEGLCEIVHSIVAPTEATLSGYSTTKHSVTWRLSDQTRRPKSSFLTIATRDDDVANSQQLVASLPHHQTGRCPPGLLPELRDEIAERIGTERFEQWLADTRWEMDSHVLICLVRNEFLLKLVRRELRGDIAEVAIAAGFENVDFRIGPAGPDVANSQQLVASLPHQTTQENPWLETLLGFLTN